MRSVFILTWNGEMIGAIFGLVILRAAVRTVVHDVKTEIDERHFRWRRQTILQKCEMLASSADDLFLSEARLDNFNEISSSATNPLNNVVRVELERRIKLRAIIVDPIVVDVEF